MLCLLNLCNCSDLENSGNVFDLRRNHHLRDLNGPLIHAVSDNSTDSGSEARILQGWGQSEAPNLRAIIGAGHGTSCPENSGTITTSHVHRITAVWDTEEK